MDNERMRILTMIEQGTITAEEGQLLLDALEKGARGTQPRWFKVRIFESGSERPKVRVTLPFKVFKLALKLGGSCQFAIPDDARRKMEAKGVHLEDTLENLDDALAEICNGERFDLVNVVDDEDGTRVEVYVE
jgi:hypothetical protein